jgi:hypothetical protein
MTQDTERVSEGINLRDRPQDWRRIEQYEAVAAAASSSRDFVASVLQTDGSPVQLRRNHRGSVPATGSRSGRRPKGASRPAQACEAVLGTAGKPLRFKALRKARGGMRTWSKAWQKYSPRPP